MLASLQIRNYILIDSLDIDFPAGLVIITGQTGAGKSIMLGALSLLLGAKADVSAIGPGSDSCVVEGVFKVEEDSPLKQLAEENDIEWDAGNLIVRRVIPASGRSRCFVNDSPVPQAVLAQLSKGLLDIHSQHETLMLSDRKFQLSMLDHFAGNMDLLEKAGRVYSTLEDQRRRLNEIESTLSSLEKERDYNEAVYDRLEAASLLEGELESLEQEHKILSNAEQIKTDYMSVTELLSPQDDERASVDVLLREASRQLSRVEKYSDRAVELRGRLDSARIELEDVLSEIESLSSAVEVSPERLEVVEDRMSLLYGLLKKHSCSSISELISVRDEFSRKLYDSTSLQEEQLSLQKEINATGKVLSSLADELHESRLKASSKFAEAIQTSVRSLELDRAVFEVALEETPVGPAGRDSVRFLFSANGTATTDVAKCASGGEMSRIMLCLKAMMAKYTSMPSMIFDEIDTGVSGSVADKMGSMICSMGQDMQVFAITHLPQVAAKGDAHYLVSKSTQGDSAVTTITKITGESRVMEIARMLSGSEVTPAAIANAESLLS